MPGAGFSPLAANIAGGLVEYMSFKEAIVASVSAPCHRVTPSNAAGVCAINEVETKRKKKIKVVRPVITTPHPYYRGFEIPFDWLRLQRLQCSHVVFQAEVFPSLQGDGEVAVEPQEIVKGLQIEFVALRAACVG